jgi:hypothetical protein
MPKVQKNLVDKVQVLADNVKRDLRKKGVIVPVKHKDGSITFDEYTMIKKDTGYFIYKGQRELAGPINLPQTAIVIANGLALGRSVDYALLDHDKWYGYKSFDEEVFTKSAANSLKTKNYDKADFCFTRASIAKQQKEVHRSDILSHFNRIKLT